METSTDAGGSPHEPVPDWLSGIATIGWRLLAVIALAVVGVGVAIELVTVTATILVSLVATIALLPLIRRLRRGGMGRTPAAALASLAGLAVVIVTLVLLALALLPNLKGLVDTLQTGISDLRDALVSWGLPDAIIGVYDRLVEAFVGILRTDLETLVGPLVTVGTVAILSIFLTFFLLQDGDRGWGVLVGSMRPSDAEAFTSRSLSAIQRVGGYLRRTALLAAVDAGVIWVVLLLLGVPLSGPLAVLTFFAGFVPYLGAVVAVVVVSLAAVAHGGLAAAAVVLLAFVATALIADRLLAKTGLGRRVDVHPLLVLIAIPAGFVLFGVLGLVALLPIVVFGVAVGGTLVSAVETADRDPSAPRPEGVPVWLDLLAQWSWRLLVALGLVWFTVQLTLQLPGVVVSVVLALVFAATLAPVATWLRRTGWRPGFAAAAATLGATVGTILVVSLAVAWTVGPLQEVVQTAVAGATRADLEWIVPAVTSIAGAIVAAAEAAIHTFPGILLSISLILLLTFYLLRDGGPLWRRGVDRVPPLRRATVDEAGSRAFGVVSGYMIGTAIIALFGAITGAVIMLILGLPLVLPIAVLGFFGGFIPYLGPLVQTGLSLLVAVAVGTTTDIVVMAIWTVVFNIVQGNFITPLVYGRTVSLHPAVVLLAIPAGGEVAGILGMFLVVPFLAIATATWGPISTLLSPSQPSSSNAPEGAPTEDP